MQKPILDTTLGEVFLTGKKTVSLKLIELIYVSCLCSGRGSVVYLMQTLMTSPRCMNNTTSPTNHDEMVDKTKAETN